MSYKNYHVCLSSRPDGEPVDENFSYKECASPGDLSKGEIRIKTLYISVDPVLRLGMNETTGLDFLGPLQFEETVKGFGGVGRVEESLHDDYKTGDLVESLFGWPWKLYFNVIPDAGSQIRKIDQSVIGANITLPLTVLGLIGLTSYLGVKKKGHIRQGANQTMVLSGAAGACGSLAGQIGRLEGCTNVVGLCGSEEKCKFLVEELGFDAAINYKTENVAERLKQTCPKGIDVYFDNVGGDISDIVIQQMNTDSHVILCGQIAVYNRNAPYPPPLPGTTQTALKDKRITRDQFYVTSYSENFPDVLTQLTMWVLQGKLKYRETITKGLENTGRAFVSMMKGGNIGKQLVHVADP